MNPSNEAYPVTPLNHDACSPLSPLSHEDIRSPPPPRHHVFFFSSPFTLLYYLRQVRPFTRQRQPPLFWNLFRE
ncbi:hypothetical protein B9Z19DRAFT_1081586 [Tuber borchii]|uniref:Uncharacterized protein n=1 Tax=Tuber borchii TaxID=42251 RepID=A0A2T6ZVG0_TUBBO|nr:hypothetical protein B9Z19DRAFT_1081586 [Tuber borchii]